MAGLLFMEGFETFGANGDTGLPLQAIIQQKWTNVDLHPAAKLSDDAYEGQGLCLDTVSSSSTNLIFAHKDKDELIIGWAWYSGTLGNGYLYQGGSFSTHISLYAYADGHFRVSYGSSNKDTATGLVISNTWYYMELKYKIHDTTGYWELHINGSLTDSETGVDTHQSDWPNVSHHTWVISSMNTRFDDIYIYDNTGDVQEPFGPVKIRALLPDGDDTTDWTSTGANHYDQVNDIPVVTANYVESDIANDVDLFTFANTTDPNNWPIYGVQLNLYAAVTDVGLFTLEGIADSNGTQDTVNEAIIDNLGGQYSFVFENDPETSNAWTIDQLNDAKFGVGVG